MASLAETQRAAAESLDEIKGYFKPGRKITLLVRSPDNPEADFCMTDDDLIEVAAMVVRRRLAIAGKTDPDELVHITDADRFYGDPVERFDLMSKVVPSSDAIDGAHFRMWCSIAARELKAARIAVGEFQLDAARYRWLRGRDVDTIKTGGVFAGTTPDNLVLNLEDLDRRIDAAMNGGAA